MEQTLRVLRSLEQEKIIGRYAIGGAMGATFYVEPVLTFDLDVFIELPQRGALLTLEPLYAALAERGYAADGECVNIAGVPVQFLPVYNALLKEALADAVEVAYGEVTTRVLRAEHLAAICAQTGRAKDRERVRMLREGASLDRDYLAGILQRHGLEDTWRRWTE